jgi:7-cyano-7-deazaguanine synthase
MPIFADYGQHCAVTELLTLQEVLPANLRNRIFVINLGSIYTDCFSRMLSAADLWSEKVTDDDFFVPYRNQLLLTAGAAVAKSKGIDDLYSAFIQSNVALATDCTTKFLQELAELTVNYGGVRLHFPFAQMSKTEVARLGVRLQVPLGATYSCLAGASTACGACPNCVDRLKALASLDT